MDWKDMNDDKKAEMKTKAAKTLFLRRVVLGTRLEEKTEIRTRAEIRNNARPHYKANFKHKS